jgi:hypothetical protein
MAMAVMPMCFRACVTSRSVVREKIVRATYADYQIMQKGKLRVEEDLFVEASHFRPIDLHKGKTFYR